jgi:hypothetical protein
LSHVPGSLIESAEDESGQLFHVGEAVASHLDRGIVAEDGVGDKLIAHRVFVVAQDWRSGRGGGQGVLSTASMSTSTRSPD